MLVFSPHSLHGILIVVIEQIKLYTPLARVLSPLRYENPCTSQIADGPPNRGDYNVALSGIVTDQYLHF